MTWIEAICTECGTVECSPKDFDLAICQQVEASYYTFRCPVCAEMIRKHAGERVIELLISEGVKPRRWSLPAEMLEEHSGPALTIDDLLDLHNVLSRDDWFQEMTRATTP